MDHTAYLDSSHAWDITFEDYAGIARRGGAPLFNISSPNITNGVASVERIAAPASPAVHRVLVKGESTLDPRGYWRLSFAGLVTRAISIEVTAQTLQHVSGRRLSNRQQAEAHGSWVARSFISCIIVTVGRP